ncbi:adenine phosphoribosyltransferase [Kiritimatiellota bacterium B12222]|nr:adenine phosphoribosyltransferase [Kiritimatiellota bacterium B12222]
MNQTKHLPPEADLDLLNSFIRDVPDFPKPGIVFKDITPLCADAKAFRHFIELMATHYKPLAPDLIVAVDARGFVFGGPLAYELGTGVVLVRKKGKLPADTIQAEYDLEYGSATLEMHLNAIKPGQKVVIIDDLLATGGTVEATINLCRQQGAEILGCAFLVELGFLHGREKLGDLPIFCPITVE